MKKLLSIRPIVLTFQFYLVYSLYYTTGSWFCQVFGGVTVAIPWQNRNRSVEIRCGFEAILDENGKKTVAFTVEIVAYSRIYGGGDET